MFHFLYKTTCSTTSCYYIGIHSTDNLDDRYLGSGYRLKQSIKKHGYSTHNREILQFANSREELLDLEESIVTHTLLEDEKCLNLSIGGRAGIPNHKSSTRSETMKSIWNDELHREKMSIVNSQNAKSSWNNTRTRNKRIKSLTESTKKMWESESHRQNVITKLKQYTGEKSSQFGTCWINKDGKALKIKRDQLEDYLSLGYSRGRK